MSDEFVHRVFGKRRRGFGAMQESTLSVTFHAVHKAIYCDGEHSMRSHTTLRYARDMHRIYEEYSDLGFQRFCLHEARGCTLRISGDLLTFYTMHFKGLPLGIS